jgi:pantothenate kinase-related protein Tda10
MQLVTTPRVTFLRELADEIVRQYGRGRMIVAIDGPLRSGKTEFGDDLAEVLRERGHRVFRASMEDFHRSREAQDVYGPDTAERYFRYGFDESALRRVLVEPFRMGGSTAFVTAVFDPARDAWVQPKWITGPADAILLIDGRFVLRPRLAELWDVRVALEGEPVDPADAIAYAESDPRLAASVVVDNRDASRPRFAASHRSEPRRS